MREAVVLVHGIWMVGWELSFLHRQLVKSCGLTCHNFRYASVVRSPRDSAVRLGGALRAIDADVIHLVAHSMGGLVVMHLFELEPNQRPGRVLMLGTPLRGSELARRLDRIPVLRWCLGRATQQGLLGDVPAWHGARPLGVIAGTRGLGLGKLLLGAVEKPNDGTVALNETRTPEVNAHLAVPYSHVGMLWSRRVTQAACRFLREGSF